MLSDFSSDNVKYVELRSTPRATPHMTKAQYMESVLRAIHEVNQDETKDIVAKYLPSIDRRNPVKMAEETLELAIRYHESHPDLLIGIDLSGDARVGDALDFIPVLERARDAGLSLAVHLAEVPNHKETKEILVKLKPNRIGHGTAMHPETGGTEEIWNLFKDSKIPLEICLTSNVSCRSVEAYEKHHLRHAFQDRIPFSLATDDKGIFFCSLTEEYERAKDILQLSQTDILNMARNVIDQIFGSEKDKIRLRQIFNVFEKTLEA